ncbi:F-box protein Pof12 [Schizosaccharomyces cryophilus OY26]|uniref:F-box protein Pof12 n=1 Tax=Schizosaccharomyces cryophilus (strain OY26 / ATCC MYA-4695 / CBS 11777 / NBRC 106824 / NRRL Y48691) TaxID=653667 RepID=S9XIN0_SCHCR|nr:F-box protein Pof12 [Schizosaccharomyces cryophilus OY26]EPY53501.1 F-box protein Pof12 [Schizosaccharomyces cryophilus OY26]
MSLRAKTKNPANIFSHETLLHIFESLSSRDIVALERVSKSWKSIAQNSSVWHNLFLSEFGKNRIRRRARISKARKNWKNEFKSESNWNSGNCKKEVFSLSKNQNICLTKEPADEAKFKVALLHEGRVYTCNTKMLYEWSFNENKMTCLNTISFPEEYKSNSPITMCVDGDNFYIALETGAVLHTKLTQNGFSDLNSILHIDSPLKSLSVRHNLLCGLTKDKSLCMFKNKSLSSISFQLLGKFSVSGVKDPISIHIELDLSRSRKILIVQLAYSEYVIAHGWTIGLQEFWITDSTIVKNRVGQRQVSDIVFSSQPASGVYQQGPYVLSSHADNTLMLHYISSGLDSSRIQWGIQLRGHVCGVEKSKLFECGKIISVSRNCTEICLWDLQNFREAEEFRPFMIESKLIFSRYIQDYEQSKTHVQDIELFDDTVMITLSDGNVMAFLFYA